MVTAPWALASNVPTMKTENFQVRAETCTRRFFKVVTNLIVSAIPEERSVGMDKDFVRNHRTEVSNEVLEIDKV